MGLILLIVATVLKLAASPIFYLYGMVRAIQKKEFNRWNLELAIAKDQYGNGLAKYLFNDILIKPNSRFKFGNIDETISSVIGKNKRNNTLTRTGLFLDFILNVFENDHSIKSIDESIN